MGEVQAASTHSLPHLIETADIRGALHNHTTLSDCEASLELMADTAGKMGWGWLGIDCLTLQACFTCLLCRLAHVPALRACFIKPGRSAVLRIFHEGFLSDEDVWTETLPKLRE